jgi:hypothetical protein
MMIALCAIVAISLFIGLAVYLWPQELRVVSCPYCSNPDRNSVYGNWEGCKWLNPNPGNGSDPPCVCDGYGTKRQMRQLGLGQ